MSGRAEQGNILIYIEIYINTGGETGTEVLIINSARVCELLSDRLEILNIGVKKQNLIVFNRNSMSAILVESTYTICSMYNFSIIYDKIYVD